MDDLDRQEAELVAGIHEAAQPKQHTMEVIRQVK